MQVPRRQEGCRRQAYQRSVYKHRIGPLVRFELNGQSRQFLLVFCAAFGMAHGGTLEIEDENSALSLSD